MFDSSRWWLFALLGLSAGRVGNAHPRPTDRDAVQRVLEAYLDVTEKKDAAALARAFHPAAKLMSVGTSGLREMSQTEWWQRISRIPGPTVTRKRTIAFIDVTGLAAVARIDFERSSDYLSLLRVDGHWKIVNKTLSTSVKE